jgi:DNA-binding cell septation regulator SpoVG
MHITIKHFDGKYPSFNVLLHSKEGQEEFITIKGCRIVDGQKGPFVSWPATKGNDGKYWQHIWANEKFSAVVLSKAQEANRPAKRQDDDAPPF